MPYDGIGTILLLSPQEGEGKGFLGKWPLKNLLQLRTEIENLGITKFHCQIKNRQLEWQK